MKILFSCGDYYPNLGGATSLVDDLACTLMESGHGVSVLTRRHAGTTETEQFHGYQIYRIYYPLRYEKFDWRPRVFIQSFGVLNQLLSFLIAGCFDTVCIGLLDMSAWYLFLLRPLLGFRIVLYLHGAETRELPATETSYRTLFRTSLRLSNAVIAVSDELKVEAGQYWPGALEKIEIIRNAVDLEMMRRTKAMQRPRPFIASVGRLAPEKDYATLIKAFGQVQEQIGDVDLVIVGEGKEQEMLMALATRCPFPERVVLMGRAEREEAISAIKGAMFFVLPSASEAFPIVAVEALAVGKAVVGSNIPGIATIIEDGRQGHLFPAGNVAALAEIIRMYCVQPETLRNVTLGAAEADLNGYDIRQIAARHLAVIEGNR